MKYIIHRTNDWWGGNDAPDPKCPNAVMEELPKYNRKVKVYTIEIDTLEELHKLQKDLGEPIIIFDGDDYDFSLPVLEIYDGWRE